MKALLASLEGYLIPLDNEQKIEAINKIKLFLHRLSPFKNEPVDCVLWIKREHIIANDYNPNVMSPTEKKLLQASLTKDGYTQPIVALQTSVNNTTQSPSRWQVIDGYHRYLLSQKNTLKKRLNGYLPNTLLSAENQDSANHMAATIRHNRARGQHQVSAMSDIIRDLSRLGWHDEKISEELGMSQDEVLRLKQISGLVELFSEGDFSEAWTVK